MENLTINSNPEQVYYPSVSFNYKTGICEISGESYMEETYKFYEPVINWISNYASEKKPINFIIRLTYFNTSSSRFILEILDTLKKYKDTGGEVTISWYYKISDPDILSEINDFIEESGTEIQIIPLA
jgi:hypothetical protein